MESFTPFTVITEVLYTIKDEEKNKKAIVEFEKLADDLGFVAPEIRDSRFWGGFNNKENFVSLCQKFFLNDEKILNIFQKTKKRYEKTGFIYENEFDDDIGNERKSSAFV
jgi:hypothetical protein